MRKKSKCDLCDLKNHFVLSFPEIPGFGSRRTEQREHGEGGR